MALSVAACARLTVAAAASTPIIPAEASETHGLAGRGILIDVLSDFLDVFLTVDGVAHLGRASVSWCDRFGHAITTAGCGHQ